FTPLVWTGYILTVDAVVFRLKGRSLLVSNRLEFFTIAVISVMSWWLFEFYNAPRFWRSDAELLWHYHNLEPDPYLRRPGYDWAFATISPALFETAELLSVTLFRSMSAGKHIAISGHRVRLLVIIGGIGAAIPLAVISPWLIPLVWLALILLFDPLNALFD